MDDGDITSILARDFARISHLFTTRERRVLEWLYGLNDERQHTMEEVGNRFGVTRVRIRQIQAKAIDKIRDIPPDAC